MEGGGWGGGERERERVLVSKFLSVSVLALSKYCVMGCLNCDVRLLGAFLVSKVVAVGIVVDVGILRHVFVA